jgi:hypothetical protein
MRLNHHRQQIVNHNSRSNGDWSEWDPVWRAMSRADRKAWVRRSVEELHELIRIVESESWESR